MTEIHILKGKAYNAIFKRVYVMNIFSRTVELYLSSTDVPLSVPIPMDPWKVLGAG